jgi:hypothetical protein
VGGSTCGPRDSAAADNGRKDVSEVRDTVTVSVIRTSLKSRPSLDVKAPLADQEFPDSTRLWCYGILASDRIRVGALVDSVKAGSDGAQADIRSGDRIIRLNGLPIENRRESDGRNLTTHRGSDHSTTLPLSKDH